MRGFLVMLAVLPMMAAAEFSGLVSYNEFMYMKPADRQAYLKIVVRALRDFENSTNHKLYGGSKKSERAMIKQLTDQLAMLTQLIPYADAATTEVRCKEWTWVEKGRYCKAENIVTPGDAAYATATGERCKSWNKGTTGTTCSYADRISGPGPTVSSAELKCKEWTWTERGRYCSSGNILAEGDAGYGAATGEKCKSWGTDASGATCRWTDRIAGPGPKAEPTEMKCKEWSWAEKGRYCKKENILREGDPGYAEASGEKCMGWRQDASGATCNWSDRVAGSGPPGTRSMGPVTPTVPAAAEGDKECTLSLEKANEAAKEAKCVDLEGAALGKARAEYLKKSKDCLVGGVKSTYGTGSCTGVDGSSANPKDKFCSKKENRVGENVEGGLWTRCASVFCKKNAEKKQPFCVKFEQRTAKRGPLDACIDVTNKGLAEKTSECAKENADALKELDEVMSGLCKNEEKPLICADCAKLSKVLECAKKNHATPAAAPATESGARPEGA